MYHRCSTHPDPSASHPKEPEVERARHAAGRTFPRSRGSRRTVSNAFLVAEIFLSEWLSQTCPDQPHDGCWNDEAVITCVGLSLAVDHYWRGWLGMKRPCAMYSHVHSKRSSAAVQPSLSAVLREFSDESEGLLCFSPHTPTVHGNALSQRKLG